MKKLILFIPVLFCSLLVRSQNPFNRAVQDIDESARPVITSLNGDLYFMTLDIRGNAKNVLYKYSSSGALIFRKELSFGAPDHVLNTLDQHIGFAGTVRECQEGPTDKQLNFICKVNSSGSVVFSSTVSVGFGDDFKAFVQHPDSSYSAFSDSVMFRFSKDGLFTGKTNLGLTNISSALVWSGNSTMLSAVENNVTSRIIVSQQGNILSTQLLPSLMDKMAFYNNQATIAKGSDGLLYKISAQGTVLGQSAFSGFNVTHFVTEGDAVYVLLNSNPGEVPAYALCDTSFNVVNLTSTTTNSITQRAMCRIDNRLAILSEGLSCKPNWVGQHEFTTLNVIALTGSNNFSHDIEITSVKADSSYAVHYFLSAFRSFLRAKVTVRNNGVKAVTSFKLNYLIVPYYHCGFSLYHEKFDISPLAPGDSITVTTNTFIIQMPTAPPQSTSISARYCFYTTLPNGEADAVLENNELCEQITLLVNSLPESSEIKNLQLFPNPVNTEIKISAEEQLSQIELFNAQGLLLKSMINAGFETTINTEDLPSGIYLVKIKSQYGSATRKVVKL